MSEKWTVLTDVVSTLGEGPVWDERKQELHWVDINGKRIHTWRAADGRTSFLQLDQMVGAAVLRESDDGFIGALERGFYRIERAEGADREAGSSVGSGDGADGNSRSGHGGAVKLTAIGEDPEKDLPNNRFNDGKCDAKGRFWAGTMGKTGNEPAGALYCLDTNGVITKVHSPVTTSNGIAWGLDGIKMYYIDTPTQNVVSFHYDGETGEISNPMVVIEIDPAEGFPDGMTMDEEGKLWIAFWGGSQVGRWDPETGRKLDSIALPASLITSAVFGGPNMDELFITSARVGLSDDELARQPHAGKVFRMQMNVRGAISNRYRG